MRFSRQEYWSGLPFPIQRIFRTQGLSLCLFTSPGLQVNSFVTSTTWEAHLCFCSVAQSCLTLCDPMDCSTPGFPVLHHLLELAQTHVHWVGYAIQPSHKSTPIRTAKIKNLTISSTGEDAKKAKHLTFSYKSKHKLTIWPWTTIPLLGVTQKKCWYLSTQRSVCKCSSKVLLISLKNWKQSTCQSSGEWVNH